MTLTALEFYSGIGAFAQAAGKFDVKIACAFDQSQAANITYKSNYGVAPSHRNLDSIGIESLADVDLWWMSPPCTPFTRRGKQKDVDDNRAQSFINLIKLLEIKRPRYLLIENVAAFAQSSVFRHLLNELEQAGYFVDCIELCASDFGVPMLRPRLFVAASLAPLPVRRPLPQDFNRQALTEYLFETSREYDCDDEIVRQFEPVLNIIDPTEPDSYAICFTSSYRKCRRAGGSLIKEAGRVRFFSPGEILGLLGFAPEYKIPDTIPIEAAYRLVGNSVDVRAINYLLGGVLQIA